MQRPVAYPPLTYLSTRRFSTGYEPLLARKNPNHNQKRSERSSSIESNRHFSCLANQDHGRRCLRPSSRRRREPDTTILDPSIGYLAGCNFHPRPADWKCRDNRRLTQPQRWSIIIANCNNTCRNNGNNNKCAAANGRREGSSQRSESTGHSCQ